MYGVVEIAGHQYRVEAGMTLDVQKLSDEAGSTVEFDKVLLVGGKKTLVGKPVVDGAKVVAEVVKHDRARKVLVKKNLIKIYIKILYLYKL